jgi:hypothetical protein
MTVAGPIRRRLLLPARDERGIALPVALLATIAALALAAVAVTSTVDVQQGAHRDSSSKSAIAAADAGVEVALLRLKRDSAELSTEKPCLGGKQPAENGWCSPVSGEVGGAEYEYRMTPYPSGGAGCEYAACLVSTGTAGGVSRRVEVALTDGTAGSSGNGESNGGSEGLIGGGDVTIEENGDARVGVGANGNVFVENNGNVCGNIRYGVGHETNIEETTGTQCPGYTISEEEVSLPPVSSFMPADIATENSDYRLATCTGTDPETGKPAPEGCQTDTYTGKWEKDRPWDPETRTISTWNNTTLTLGGGDYFICRLELKNNSHLVMADGAQIRIFFDTPENCGMSNGETQVFVSENANITSTGFQPSEEEFALPGLYLTGSTSIETRIEWRPNSGTNEVFIYAPNTNINLLNNAVFKGTIVGNDVYLHENAIIEHDEGFELPEIINPWSNTEAVPVFTSNYYVECSGAASPAPDSGC